MGRSVKVVVQQADVLILGANGDSLTYNCMSNAQAAYLAGIIRSACDAAYIEGWSERRAWKWGWLVRRESLWMGVHYSPHNKRWCINLLPCVTLWITKPGGNTP